MLHNACESGVACKKQPSFASRLQYTLLNGRETATI